MLERVHVRFRYKFLLFLFGGFRGWSLRGFCARAGADEKETGSDDLQVPTEEVGECMHIQYGLRVRTAESSEYSSTTHSKCD